jgi:hypothetical protein
VDLERSTRNPGEIQYASAVVCKNAYSRRAAVDYARKWALSVNPAYVRMLEDCTDFVSQALFAGGWKMIFPAADTCGNLTDDATWWYRKDECWHVVTKTAHSSFTWGSARYMWRFMKFGGRAIALGNIWDMVPGDVLQKDYNDWTVKHTMMLTKKTDENLYFSGHTLDELDEPFFGSHGILSRNHDHHFWAWRILGC